MSSVPAHLLQTLSHYQQTRLLASLDLLPPADVTRLVSQLIDVDFDLLQTAWRSAIENPAPVTAADRAEQAAKRAEAAAKHSAAETPTETVINEVEPDDTAPDEDSAPAE